MNLRAGMRHINAQPQVRDQDRQNQHTQPQLYRQVIHLHLKIYFMTD
jgi:hypothetical protein